MSDIYLPRSEYNLPPGVRSCDLPGNGLADDIREEVYREWEEHGVPAEACEGCEVVCHKWSAFHDDRCPEVEWEVEWRMHDE